MNAILFTTLEAELVETQAMESLADINIIHQCSYTSAQCKAYKFSYKTKHKVNASWGLDREEFMRLFVIR